jgi:hypothetical protein
MNPGIKFIIIVLAIFGTGLVSALWASNSKSQASITIAKCDYEYDEPQIPEPKPEEPVEVEPVVEVAQTQLVARSVRCRPMLFAPFRGRVYVSREVYMTANGRQFVRVHRTRCVRPIFWRLRRLY